MRGKDQDVSFFQKRPRITPAYAGKRRRSVRLPWKPWDHPRLCGEKLLARLPEFVSMGSPPPMRGKDMNKSKIDSSIRITPAYAGKRLRRQAPRCQSEDHPRLCGEKQTVTNLLMANIGSPPPMRGKVISCTVNSKCIGITPAYAGKRANIFARVLLQWDHPRLCGEKIAEPPMYLIVTGSPPPMRGKGPMCQWRRAHKRITPAYAGKRFLNSLL